MFDAATGSLGRRLVGTFEPDAQGQHGVTQENRHATFSCERSSKSLRAEGRKQSPLQQKKHQNSMRDGSRVQDLGFRV